MITPPSAQSQLVTPTGHPTPSWMRFFQAIAGMSGAIVSVAPGASPFTYTAPTNGTFNLVGGTISALALTRARTTIGLMASGGLIPLSAGDAVTITYSKAPTVSFIPA